MVERKDKRKEIDFETGIKEVLKIKGAKAVKKIIPGFVFRNLPGLCNRLGYYLNLNTDFGPRRIKAALDALNALPDLQRQ